MSRVNIRCSTAVMALSVLVTSSAFAEVKLELEGHPLATTPPPVMRNGRVFVPLRTVSEALKAEVKWDQPTKTVTLITQRGQKIALRIGVPYMKFGERVIKIEAAPFVYQGATMVPLRLVAEAYNANVKWHPESQTVAIEMKHEKKAK